MAREPLGKLEFYVGTFIVTGLVLVSGMIIVFGSGVGLWRDTYAVVVKIGHIGALQRGAPVKLGGYNIGTVSDITLKNRRIEIECAIDAEVKLPTDSTAQIAGAGLVGDTFLEFSPGNAETVFNREIKTVDEARQEGQFAHGQGPVPPEEIFRRIADIGDQVTALLKHIEDIVGDDEFKTNIRESVANVNATTIQAKRLLSKLQSGAGHVETASKNIVDTTEKVNAMASSVQASLTKVLDKRNIDAINESIASIRQISRSTEDLITSQQKPIQETIASAKSSADNIKTTTEKVKTLSDSVDTEEFKRSVDAILGTLQELEGLAKKVKDEPLSALVLNKAADRIILELWDDRDFRRLAPEEKAEYLNKWWIKNMKTLGYLPDPKYQKGERPYPPDDPLKQ